MTSIYLSTDVPVILGQAANSP